MPPFSSCPFLVAFGSFTTFTLISPNNKLTPAIAFVSLTLFNQIRSPLTMIGMLINSTVTLIVSNKRIKEFLVAEEIDDNAVDFTQDTTSPEAIVVKGADFSWEGGDNTLHDINLEVPRGSA